MKNQETVQKFIELRAQGLPFARIAQQLEGKAGGVSVPTRFPSSASSCSAFSNSTSPIPCWPGLFPDH